jgi:hypothetical protein
VKLPVRGISHNSFPDPPESHPAYYGSYAHFVEGGTARWRCHYHIERAACNSNPSVSDLRGGHHLIAGSRLQTIQQSGLMAE